MERETLDGAIENVRRSVREFDDNLAQPIVESFPTLAPLLREIRALLAGIDLNHLSSIPVRTLTALHGLIFEGPIDCIKNFMVKAYPAEDQFKTGTGRPIVHIRNNANISSWCGQLEVKHHELFHLIGPIVAHHQARVDRVATSSRCAIDMTRSISKSGTDGFVWRYMPLRNLLRCETGCGIWMPSLRMLRAWSDRAIVDTHEGEIPPVVQRLKEEVAAAVAAGKDAVRQFRDKYKLDEDQFKRLVHNVEKLALEIDNTFVSSWSQKKSESMPMWGLYGDAGKGVAVRSKLGKLFDLPWRVPIELSGLVGPNRISTMILRDVKYLSFADTDEPPSVDDLHLPFLKRDEFEDEREVRVVAFSSHPLPAQGFTLLCNLTDLVEEIVVGPHADFDATVSEIKKRAFDLAGVTIRPSTVSKSK